MTVFPPDLDLSASQRATVSSSESKSGCVPTRSTAAISKTEESSGPCSAHQGPRTSSKDFLETAGKDTPEHKNTQDTDRLR